MSWDKNTDYASFVDPTIRILDMLKYPYILKNTVKVRDDGLNGDGPIQLRALYFKDAGDVEYVIVEKMMRTPDCDSDDSVESVTMKSEEYNPDTFVYDYTEDWE